MERQALYVRRCAVWVSAFSVGATLAFGGFAPASAMGAGGKAPVIESTGSGIDKEVTADAVINPEGLVTTFEITLGCGTCGPTGGGLKTGQLPAVQEAISVSLNVTGIAAGTYRFHVTARNAAGEASTYGELIVPQPPPGSCPTGCGSNEQHGAEIPNWSIKLSELESAETRGKYEAEQRAKQQEHEEQQAREQARIAEEARVPMCAVPSLRGDTVSRARRVLEKAHCRLGRIIRRSHRRGILRVVEQNPESGSWLAAGTSIVIVCRPELHHRRGH